MKNPILFFYLFFSLAVTAQPVKDLINQGQQFLGEKKFTEAIDIYNKAFTKDSTNYNVFTGRGTAYFELKEFQLSYNDFSRAIALEPDSAIAYHYRANLMYILNYTDEAIADNTKAIERTTDEKFLLGCFINRGSAKVQKRDFKGAYEDFHRAYSYDTTDISVLNNLGTVLDKLDRQEEAIMYLKKAIALDSSFVGPYVNIGFQYSQLGRYEEALVYFNKALELEKEEPLTLNNRGFTRFKLNDLSGALDDINKSIFFFATNAYAYKNRALVYLALDKKEEACSDLKKARELQFEKQYGSEVNELLKKHCQ